MKSAEKSITKAELVAVFIIMGLIAAIIIPSVLGVMNVSKENNHLESLDKLMNAIDTCLATEQVDHCGVIEPYYDSGNESKEILADAGYISIDEFESASVKYTIDRNTGKVTVTEFTKGGIQLNTVVTNKDKDNGETNFREMSKEKLA